jgi:hypothetical protein
MREAVRSVLAVLGGYMVMIVVVVVFTALSERLHPQWFRSPDPTGPYLVANILASFAAALLGGFAAA